MEKTVYTANEFRFAVVRPTLQYLQRWSRDSEELIVGTAAQETHLGALGRRQMDGGPALGILQIEPATHALVWAWMKKHRPGLALRVLAIADGKPNVPELMVTSDRYSVAIGRVLYLSIPAPIPLATDVAAQAVYYKKYWNRDGKATVQEYLENYERLVA